MSNAPTAPALDLTTLTDAELAAEAARASAHQRVVVRGSSDKAIDAALAHSKALAVEQARREQARK